jgi:2-oxoglutarate ferredoxin oxidoreductase subunit alpha
MMQFMDGNQAVVKAAIDAGCDFFAGYPITPATSILLGMVKELRPRGGIVIQGEDEIASMGFCIGASAAGKKVMTATSGPGFALYSENLGMALMAEIPMVIVVVQRMGPATGSATKVAQGDVLFSRWGTSGGLPLVVLAPSSVEECYSLTVRAFNLSESLRTPVIVLTDKELALTKTRVDLDELGKIKIVNRSGRDAEDPVCQPYHFDDPEDVPLFVRFGSQDCARLSASTHDGGGYICKDPETIGKFIDHFQKKIDTRKTELDIANYEGSRNPDVLVIGYGITARSCLEAVHHLKKEKVKVGLLNINSLWPVPEASIKKAAKTARVVIVAELNLGLYKREIERILCDKKVVGLNRMDTHLITPEEIIREVMHFG